MAAAAMTIELSLHREAEGPRCAEASRCVVEVVAGKLPTPAVPEAFPPNPPGPPPGLPPGGTGPGPAGLSCCVLPRDHAPRPMATMSITMPMLPMPSKLLHHA